MFQTICIKPDENTFPTDIGFIAENLLFYKEVILILNSETLPILINNCDLGILQEILSNGNLRICVCENMLGVLSRKTKNNIIYNDVVSISSDRITAEQIVFDVFLKATGRRGFSKRNTQKILPYVEPIRYDVNVCELVREDLTNRPYTKSIISALIKHHNPQIDIDPSSFQYDWIKKPEGYLFVTNLDYGSINKKIKINVKEQFISTEKIILEILQTYGDLHLASILNGEIATTSLRTHLMKVKFKDIYQNSTQKRDDIYQFSDVTLSDGYAIREAINSGNKDFKDFLKVLHKADKFKNWLENIADDKSMIEEYFKTVTNETWIDKLPSKVFRWSFFTGAGLALDIALTGGVGTLIGLGLSLGDALILDKVIKGWKPNTFVEGDLKKFIKSKNT